MKKSICILFVSLVTLPILAQNNQVNSNIGLSLGGGFSNLFYGDISQNKPQIGGGGDAALFYELQYNHFLFRTGVGAMMTINQNMYTIPSSVLGIQEYASMKYHYDFTNFQEKTSYNTAYAPVMFGGIFRQVFFLVGAKVGFYPFMSTTTPQTDYTVWAQDEDVIGGITNAYTHDLGTFHGVGDKQPYQAKPLNIMGSVEIGLNLDRRAWMDARELRQLEKNERMQQRRRNYKKPFRECLHYRLSVFADYGFTNCIQYTPNPIPYPNAGTYLPEGGIVAYNSVSDLKPYSALGFAPNADCKMNNLFVGVKLAIMYEFPHKKKVTGSSSYPAITTFVSNELTGKPIVGALVRTIDEDNPKRKPMDKTTIKEGKATRGYPAAHYAILASKSGYYPHDTVRLHHQDEEDTVYIALYPHQTFVAQTIDAKTDRPVAATIMVYNAANEVIYSTSVDTANNKMNTILDGRQRYRVCASATGYEDLCDSIATITEVKTLRMEPKEIRKFILRNMFFATAQTKILPSSENALMELYRLLSENPDLKIRIIGHTDDVGSIPSNQTLSDGRSASVRNEMIKRGIDPKRIETAGHGELDPVVENDSDEHRQMNRRVEIEILSGTIKDATIENDQIRK